MKDKTDTKELLLKVAKEEFLYKGFEKASMRTICKKANVTTGAAYFFFKDKDDIFCHLVDNEAKVILDYIVEIENENKIIRDDKKISLDNAIDINTLQIKGILKYMYDNFDVFVLLLCKSTGSSMENFYDRMVESFENLNRDYIMNKRDTGEIGVYFDENILHNLVSLQVSAIVEPIRHQLPKEEALKQVDAIARFFYGGWNELMRLKKA
ncbi:TetR/AcrR family transcriptional regulator [Clostridium sporogenes]|uniref:TetR/AcrR family transcriptional regulator n=1 Tax=Clostridium sporogenes TaxID=1509 RepID=UPI00214A8644|nr:TetR/AcrR family transcriptional regulator [Clostridium sporogenes]MCR1975710.1 TetR/AcrR family transcriptional regulator [Clostridium sporogenes]